MKKQNKTSAKTYFPIEKNIYKTEYGKYRVRVVGYSVNVNSLTEARKMRKLMVSAYK